MRTLFNDVAVAHNEDDIALFDRLQAVGDNKTRPAAHHLGKRLLNSKIRTLGSVSIARAMHKSCR